ncbi:MAG: MFS transporter, partial [bacterium]
MNRFDNVAYALPAVPIAFLGLPLYVYMPAYYSEFPAIGLAAAGLVFLVARMSDLITDPMVAYLVDRYRDSVSYAQMILLGLPILLLGAYWLFFPSATISSAGLAVSLMVTYLGLTLVTIPYYAWSAELADSSNSHRGIAGWREGAVVTGMILALVLIAIYPDRDSIELMGQTFLIMVPASLVALFCLPKPPAHANRLHLSLLDAAKSVSRPMRSLLLIYFVNALAAAMPATLFVIFSRDTVNLDGSETGILLLSYLCAGVLALPFWMKAAKRFGELSMWKASMLISIVGFLPAIFIGEGELHLFLLVCLVTGSTLGADVALPVSVQARLSVLDSDSQQQSRHGISFGLWGMTGKLSLALAAGIALPALAFFEGIGLGQASLPWLYVLLPVTAK